MTEHERQELLALAGHLEQDMQHMTAAYRQAQLMKEKLDRMLKPPEDKK